MTPQHIGFIGLGVMGTPMATHLAQAGHHVWLHDAQTDVALDLANAIGANAVALEDPRAVGAHSDIVFTMLPHGQVVQSVALGLERLELVNDFAVLIYGLPHLASDQLAPLWQPAGGRDPQEDPRRMPLPRRGRRRRRRWRSSEAAARTEKPNHDETTIKLTSIKVGNYYG
jgi:hypothetical protein